MNTAPRYFVEVDGFCVSVPTCGWHHGTKDKAWCAKVAAQMGGRVVDQHGRPVEA